MKAIDKIIFNELASRRAVVLPGVGTLSVTRRAAQAAGKEIKAPVNRVVFSRKEVADAPSVVALMEAMGVGREAAEGAYKEWLQGVRKGDDLTIDGVGNVKQDLFTPSTELEQMLNPARTPVQNRDSVPLPAAASTARPAPAVSPGVPPAVPPSAPAGKPAKKDGNGLTIALVIVVIVLALALAAVTLCRNCCPCNKECAAESTLYNKAEEKAPQPLHVEIGEGRDAVIPAHELTPPEPKTAAAQGRYHLIAGSFVYDDNADKMVARYSREHPELTVEKLTTNAWVMISVFTSDDIREVERAKTRLAATLDNREMWIYKKK